MSSASSASRAAGVGEASSRRPKVSASPNTDAVSASVSGVLWWKIALLRGERRVDAVAELVREHEHVAAPAGEVEQDVGVHGRDGVGAEGAAALAAAGRRVDPALVEEALGEARRARGEKAP